MNVPLVIGPEDVFKYYLDNLEEITSVLEETLADFSSRNGKTIQPLRSATNVEKYNGLLLTMPAYSKRENALVTKVVTVYPDNSKKGLPSVQANVLLFNSEMGTLNCIIDGNMLTALRTAHVSAIATKHLSSLGTNILTLLGAGTQAKSHIQIFTKMFKISEIRIWSRRIESAESLAELVKGSHQNVHVFSKAEEAVKDADVIVVATHSSVPLLMSNWIKVGAHINAVGACDPKSQELESNLMTSSTIYVDSIEAALVESGDIIISKVEIYGEVGEAIAHKKEKIPNKTTVFKSLGMAIEDAVTANIVYKKFIGEDM